MEEAISHEAPDLGHWGAMLLRGVAALLFAIVALSNPNISVAWLAALYGGYALADGALSVYASRRAVRTERKRLLAVEAMVNVVSAVSALAFPAAAPLRLAAGLRGVVVGSCDAAWTLRRTATDGGSLLGLGGIASVMFGLLVLGWPGPGVLALPWLLGLGAMVSGALILGGAMTRIQPRTAAVPGREEASAS